MNERIRLLAEQAGLVGGGYANGTKIMTWRESFDNPGSLEKFAELIVIECLQKISGLIVEENFENLDAIDPWLKWNQALGHAVLEIEQHFFEDHV